MLNHTKTLLPSIFIILIIFAFSVPSQSDENQEEPGPYFDLLNAGKTIEAEKRFWKHMDSITGDTQISIISKAGTMMDLFKDVRLSKQYDLGIKVCDKILKDYHEILHELASHNRDEFMKNKK